ncbi:hypothetical protein NCS57_01298000 [Fusarium keratoplasticum]|uniref:Uncharacterized protein n=1 Tax=Fusarium keratoplasticum TaxID=1328300 RepID=A0ACC0QFV2_9HYPO|nr:hypothetical protein NCS57_01298000 [Fusarium keratoplasticum]KAI8652345.1 hypothetical protein NCS57_01298000 [Fusarium keratoplasticum]KAI8653084.1 hypothetical protein NCS55_01291900 [Fusarium keratoplasticum]
MPTSESCNSPTPEPRAPRHPAPWRLVEAILYEHRACDFLPDPVETAGSHLVNAPSTPTSNQSHDPDFVERLHRCLELAIFRQEIRRSMYGTATADDIRPGHTPPGLREEMRRAALDGLYDSDSSTSSGRSLTTISANTPQSCDMVSHAASKQTVAPRLGIRTGPFVGKPLDLTPSSPPLSNLDTTSPPAASVSISKKRKHAETDTQSPTPARGATNEKRRRRLNHTTLDMQ